MSQTLLQNHDHDVFLDLGSVAGQQLPVLRTDCHSIRHGSLDGLRNIRHLADKGLRHRHYSSH